MFRPHVVKTLEAWNKLIVKQKFYVSSWLITEINILKCTVSKMSKNILLKLTTVKHNWLFKLKLHEEVAYS